jgi:hypothetical protein
MLRARVARFHRDFSIQVGLDNHRSAAPLASTPIVGYRSIPRHIPGLGQMYILTAHKHIVGINEASDLIQVTSTKKTQPTLVQIQDTGEDKTF